MGHEEHQQIGLREDLRKGLELDGGVLVKIGFACKNLQASLQKLSGDMTSWGLAQIINIGLEGQAHTADAGGRPS